MLPEPLVFDGPLYTESQFGMPTIRKRRMRLMDRSDQRDPLVRKDAEATNPGAPAGS